MPENLKRRDFFKRSVGAGLALSAAPYGAFSPLSAEASTLGKARAAGQTLYDKIFDAHIVADLGGRTALLHVDRCLHGGVGEIVQMIRDGVEMPAPHLHLATDKSVSSSPNRYADRSLTLGNGWRGYIDYERELAELGVKAFGMDDPRAGIHHVVAAETGFTLPGVLLVASDSHTCTHGALGCVSWHGAESDLVLRTQTIIRERSDTRRINWEGRLGPWVNSRDATLYTIGALGAGLGAGYAVEYAGPVVRRMSMEDRLAITNMAIEMGAHGGGQISPDETTYQYLYGREFSPKGNLWDQALSYWRTLPTDADAVFDREDTLDLTNIGPQITWGIASDHVMDISGRVPNPADAPPGQRELYEEAIAYSGLRPGEPIEGTPIDEAFIGACGQSRIEHLRAAARVVEGRRVASNVKSAWVLPGSRQVKAQAESEGLDRIFKEAGFDWREPACSKCIAGNEEYVQPGDRVLTNSPRNFVGRMGADSIAHVASSPTVAAGAIAGRIVDVRRLMAGEIV